MTITAKRNIIYTTGTPLRAAEKYLIKPLVRYGFGEQAMSDYDAFFGFGLEPSSNYEDLTKAINNGDSAKAMRYMEIIINKGGNMDNYMKAKTGGAGLKEAQRLKAYALWKDVMLKASLDEHLYRAE